MKVTEVRVGQVWKNYKTKVEKSVASVTEDEAMMDDMTYISINTLLAGKSWKCVSENAVEHEEETAGDGTPYSEVMEEIVQDEKSLADHYIKDKKKAKKQEKKADKKVEKAEKPKKEKKAKREKNIHIEEILEYVFKSVDELGGNVGVPRDAEMKFRALRKENGKQFCKIMWSGKSVKLFSKVKIDEYGCYTINYPLPNVYEFIQCDEAVIMDVLSQSFNECIDKKSKKKKEEK